MLHSICTSASLVAALTISAFSCHPPKRSDNTISFSREEFEQIAASEESYGYNGSGHIQRGARLGVSTTFPSSFIHTYQATTTAIP